MILTFDSKTYTNLLVEVTPKIIETEAEYDRFLQIAESLTFNPARSPEQTALQKLLILLIEAYETRYFPLPEASPSQVLRHILEASGTQVIDLVEVIGPEATVLELLNGDRPINPVQAKILGDRFRVCPSLFQDTQECNRP